MSARYLLLTALAWLAAVAQTTEPPAHQKLIPTLWVQSSIEWKAVCRQSYLAARQALEEGLKDPFWTAVAEQASHEPGRLAGLPRAVILDIDETVLDNSPGQARRVRAGAGFDLKLWSQWVSESKAEEIPGALEFCRYAAARGVTLFYISNREGQMEQATRRNLDRLGFPLDRDVDTVLLRGEREGWGSDKSSRRGHVASTHRVVLLIGDDLGDFLGGARDAAERRVTLAAPYQQYWGRKWFILPNPSYGSWEEANYTRPIPADPAEQLRQKLAALESAQP